MAPTTRSRKKKLVQTPATNKTVAKQKIRGIIKNFIPYRGFGFLTPDDEPDKEVFVYLKNLVGYEGNEFPFFPKGTPVEFIKAKDDKGWCAHEVSQPGGAKLVSAMEDPGKNYNRDVLYTGTVHFFNYRMGYGFINCDVETIEWGGKTSELKTFVKEQEGEGAEHETRSAASVWFTAEEIVGEVNVRKKLNVGDKVQFNVYIDEKGLGAGKVLLLEAASTQKRKSFWTVAGTKRRKKKKSVQEIAEMETYVSGNFRGALQIYFQQMKGGVQTAFDTEKDPNDDCFVTTVRTIGHGDDLIEGTGKGANKKMSIQSASLDLILNLDLISKEKHMELIAKTLKRVLTSLKYRDRSNERHYKTVTETLN